MRTYLLLLTPSYLLILLGNYFLGTNKIIEAHKNGFNGGMCGACQSCFESICNSRSGFDFYYLFFGFLLFAFVVGFINAFEDRKLSTSLLIVALSSIGYLISTELIIQIFDIPVLYTHFMEGRQSLDAFFTISGFFVIVSLFFSVVAGLAGNVAGFPALLIRRKLLKNGRLFQ